VARDAKQAVLFAFLHAQQYGRQSPAIRLAGLDEQAVYRVRPLYGKLAEPMETASGALLMYGGLRFDLKGEFDGAAVVIERID